MTAVEIVTHLIVLNNDTLVCEGCHELNASSETTPETDFGTFPMGRVTHGQCATCGAVTQPTLDNTVL